jgi:hypothetical protein
MPGLKLLSKLSHLALHDYHLEKDEEFNSVMSSTGNVNTTTVDVLQDPIARAPQLIIEIMVLGMLSPVSIPLSMPGLKLLSKLSHLALHDY